MAEIHRVTDPGMYFFDAPQEVHPERLWPLEHGCKGVVYDLGCGTHKTDESFIGVDRRPVTDITAPLDDLPFEGGCADAIVSRHSLEHMLDPIKTLMEWRRVLKREGKLYIILPDHEFLDTMHPLYSNGEHLHAYTRESFTTLVAYLEMFGELLVETVVPNWSFGVILEKW